MANLASMLFEGPRVALRALAAGVAVTHFLGCVLVSTAVSVVLWHTDAAYSASRLSLHIFPVFCQAVGRALLGIRVKYHSDFEAVLPSQIKDEAEAARPLVFFGNHPKEISLAPHALCCSRHAPGRLVSFVVKKELLGTPIGMALQYASALPIDRNRGGIEQIEEWASIIKEGQPFAAVVFPDGTRGSALAREKVLEKLLVKMDTPAKETRLREICKHLMPPKTGGIWAIRNILPQARFVMVAIAHDDGVESIWDSIKSHGTTVHFKLTEVALPADYDELQERLMSLWHEDILPFYLKVTGL